MAKTTKNNNLKVETSKAYGKFTLVRESWMPEVRRGDSLRALVADIKKHGLQEPIIVDTDGKVHVGRSRFVACKAAKVAIRFIRVSTEEAQQRSRSRGIMRFHTVLDRVRFVEWVSEEIRSQEKSGEHKKLVSEELRNTWGWSTGASLGQVQGYLAVIDKLSPLKGKAKAKVEKVLRVSPHLHAAQVKLRIKKASNASPRKTGQGREAGETSPQTGIIEKLKGALGRLGRDPRKATKDKLVRFVEKARALIEPTKKLRPRGK